ncbi:MAG: hypothetical protein Q9191_006824, partial [Dirinaria sp. TL-2023a]
QADRGLYGTSRILFGNIVSKKNEIKTRRKWHPNMHSKRLWSDALGELVRVKVQARVLRTIDKVGGLDAYLLGDTAGRIKELGPYGWKLRWRVMGTESVRARFREERKRLGVPEEGLVLIGSDGRVLSEEGVGEEVRGLDEELDNADRKAEMERETESLVGRQVEEQEQPPPREVRAVVREAQEMERPLVRERPREETDAGRMEEQQAPTKEEKKKSVFQRWFGRW